MSAISSKMADVLLSMDMTTYNRNMGAFLGRMTEIISSIDTAAMNQSLGILSARMSDVISSIDMTAINKSMAIISSRLIENFSSLFEGQDFSWLNSMGGIISYIDEYDGFNYNALETEEELSDFIETKDIVKSSRDSISIHFDDKQKHIFAIYIYP
jgi:hypothetical protein